MFEWNMEDMKLLNEKGSLYFGKEKIYSCENDTTKEDKIAFIDSMQDEKMSYLLSLIKKFNEDKDNLPKDNYNKVKTTSLKAWIKRNDKKYGNPIIDDWHHYGKFYFLGCERWITWEDCENVKGNCSYDTYENLVDEIFHRQLKKCRNEEYKYFLAHDEYSVLKQKFRDKKYNTTFGVHIGTCSDGSIFVYKSENDDNWSDTKRDITIDELKDLLSKYDRLDKLVEEITNETNIVY